MDYKQNLKNDIIKGKLKKTDYIIYGSNGNRGTLKRVLYIDEKGHYYAKYFGSWWSYTNKEIEHYGIKDISNNEYKSVNFENLGKSLI